MRIAPLQKQQLDFLQEKLAKLVATVDRSSRNDIEPLQDRLESWAAKVAVIGQVKAGKSTFLNALLGQHDFLPSDVNPWTSVVTNMRINIHQDPETGAEFHFFDEGDWSEIMDGSSHIRKMAEQLLPGFDTEILKQQSQELREKAQRRLGAHYRSMLGSKHEYAFISPDLLKRYVCAGPGSDEGLTREALGRYAALTREANVFMRLPEFLVPTIVTDTPGVNDPFLVRDEVTCRSLDRSDVFVVVLSAHQALTDVDIGLIRILAQQDGKDVLIFVNRIDEIEEYDKRYERVTEDVVTRLKKAIPEIEFTILAGSAFMADAALRLDAEGERIREELDTETLAAFLKKRFGKVPADRAERLLLGSGLIDIKRTLSMVIDNGIGCRQLSQLMGDMSAQIATTTFATKRERGSVQTEIEKISSHETFEFVEALEEEIDAVTNVQAEVDFLVEGTNETVETMVGKSWGNLEKQLNTQVDSFISSTRKEIANRIVRDKIELGATEKFDIDLAPLHMKMEEAVRNGFNGARKEIDSLLSSCMRDCERLVSEHFEDEFQALTLNDLPFETFSTTLAMSKKTLETTFVTEKSWAFWRSKAVDKKKTFETMRALAVAELRPAIEKLLRAYSEAQAERATAGIERISVMQRMLEKTLTERSRRLKNDKRLLREVAEDPNKRAQVLARLQSQIDVLEKRLQDLATLDSSLAEAPILEAA